MSSERASGRPFQPETVGRSGPFLRAGLRYNQVRMLDETVRLMCVNRRQHR